MIRFLSLGLFVVFISLGTIFFPQKPIKKLYQILESLDDLYLIDKKEVIKETICNNVKTGFILKHNLLYEETFEGTDPFHQIHQQFSEEHSFQAVTEPVFYGENRGNLNLGMEISGRQKTD
jgi:hypothetical protein